jgi:hypothetical protein
VITPRRGMLADYDAVVANIERIQKELADYLETQSECVLYLFIYLCPGCNVISITNAVFVLRSYFGARVVYRDVQKEIYQLEVPIKAVPKTLPADYQLQSQTKDCRRYWTKFIRDRVPKLNDLCEDRDDIRTTLCIFCSFDPAAFVCSLTLAFTHSGRPVEANACQVRSAVLFFLVDCCVSPLHGFRLLSSGGILINTTPVPSCFYLG